MIYIGSVHWIGTMHNPLYDSSMDQKMPLLVLILRNAEILQNFISFGGCEGCHTPFKTTH